MPWLETEPMTERMRLVLAVERGEQTMAELCRQFGISRKTGYKWLARYAAAGALGLRDQSRAPHRCPHAVSPEVREAILALRRRYPTWGPKKLAVKLEQQRPRVVVPAPSTIGDILATAGVVVARRRRRRVPPRTQPLAQASAPNVVWCADFKGDFVLGDGTRCYPFTLSDADSRYLLRCQALPTTATERVQPLCEAAFREYGVPERIRTDNGPPFASIAAGGLTPLSVWWVKLGILPERIDPGKPNQNGRHERLHLTLKTEACRNPGHSLRGQQQHFDAFRQVYNEERPHEALGQRPPATVYQPSPRPFPDRLPELTYPEADGVRWVRPNGAIRWQGAEIYVTQTLAGEPVGVTQVADGRWQLTFGPLLLGTWHEPTGTLVPVPKPRGRTDRRTPTTTTTTG
jgi:transposase InsO family protein